MLLLIVSATSVYAANENRIWLDAKINNQPVRLIFDTGCNTVVLFRSTAERLRLQITPPPPGIKPIPGTVLDGYTNSCELKLWNQTIKTRFNIVNMPKIADSEVEGLIGWPVLRSNIIEFNAKKGRMQPLSRLPAKVKSWQKFPIRSNSGCLVLEIPRADGGTDKVIIDTGSSEEVSLSSKLWRQWREEHPNDPITLTAYYMPGSGTVIAPVMWATRIHVGPIELRNVMIKEANITETAIGGSNFLASLPMEALERKGLVVDGKGGYAFLSPQNSSADLPVYNRLGAVFAPSSPDTDDLIAHVAKNSPAERAGIRDGDILLKMGSRDMSDWRDQPTPKTPPLTEQPEGTKLVLILKREDVSYETTAVLEDILRPKDEKPELWQKALRWVREHKPPL